MMCLSKGCNFGYSDLMQMSFKERIRWCYEVIDFNNKSEKAQTKRYKELGWIK